MLEPHAKEGDKTPNSVSIPVEGTDDDKQNGDGKTLNSESSGAEGVEDGKQNVDATEKRAGTGFGRHGRTLATSKSLFVTGFAPVINKIHVEKLFSKFGRLERISDFMQKPGSTAGWRYCFVEYDSIENAQKALDNLDGRMLLRKRLVVKPSHADPGSSSGTKANAAPMNPAKERVLIDKKIAALRKKIQESQGGD